MAWKFCKRTYCCGLSRVEANVGPGVYTDFDEYNEKVLARGGWDKTELSNRGALSAKKNPVPTWEDRPAYAPAIDPDMIAKGIAAGRKQVYFQKGLLDTKAFSGFSSGEAIPCDNNSDSSGSSCNSNQSYSFSGNDEEQDAGNGIDFHARWAAFRTPQQ